jgi:hypothetical protein
MLAPVYPFSADILYLILVDVYISMDILNVTILIATNSFRISRKMINLKIIHAKGHLSERGDMH